ncbi:MAG: hypothetical protein HYZ83_08285 [Candidatus Omnitrophica bacterium]|nr:hypothetical protein [Candidatus Omnitrophota bacterium]
MSLKFIHILFILLSTALAFGLALWGIRDYQTAKNISSLVLGILGFAGAGLLLYYLFWFIQKIKRMAK